MLFHPLWSNSKIIKEHNIAKADEDLCFTDFLKSLDLKSSKIINESTSNNHDSQDNKKSVPTTNEKTIEKILINDDFIDDKNTSASWNFIFEQIGQWSNSELEKVHIKQLCDNSQKFEGKEKPNREGTFKALKEKKDYPVDALWEDSHVMLFSSDKEESYKFAINKTNYKCYYLDDENFNIDELLNTLENK